MIKASHKWTAEKIFHTYVYRLLRKHFTSITLFDEFPEIDPILPTLLIPNHNTWWDGFFIYFLNDRIIKQKIYLMMFEQQLKRYPFFSQVGAYGIYPENPKAALTSLKYTLEILNEPASPKSLVCIFPQGELQPWHPKGLKFKPGIEWIIRKWQKPVNLIPLAMRAEFLDDQLPRLFFMAEKNFIIDRSSFKGLKWLETTCRNQLYKIQKSIIDKKDGHVLLTGKSSVQKRFDQFRF
ncbi:MAG: lysophospholipid acyltransferase family protein [Calditrichaceae bacterium]|jgi:1-acyl-sn-glycerol-3-phosphate acyltransferase